MSFRHAIDRIKGSVAPLKHTDGNPNASGLLSYITGGCGVRITGETDTGIWPDAAPPMPNGEYSYNLRVDTSSFDKAQRLVKMLNDLVKDKGFPHEVAGIADPQGYAIINDHFNLPEWAGLLAENKQSLKAELSKTDRAQGV